MKYLLDTNVCINFLRGNNVTLHEKFMAVSQENKYLCSVVVSELYYGAYKSQQEAKNLETVANFAARFQLLTFDNESAKIFGQIRTFLEKQGTPIGAYDLQIAAIALQHDLTLVTHNTREFSRISLLQLDDWEF